MILNNLQHILLSILFVLFVSDTAKRTDSFRISYHSSLQMKRSFSQMINVPTNEGTESLSDFPASLKGTSESDISHQSIKECFTNPNSYETICPTSLRKYLEEKMYWGLSVCVGDDDQKRTKANDIIENLLNTILSDRAVISETLHEKISESAISCVRKTLKSKVESYAKCIRGSKGYDISQLTVSALKEIFDTYTSHNVQNKKVFEDITSHHQTIKQIDWSENIKDEKHLQIYADAATVMGNKSWVQSGFEWINNMIQDFYYNTNNARLPKRLKLSNDDLGVLPLKSDDLVKMIDIGSCFNYFQKYKYLDVLALDLQPGHESVFQCDFLNVSFVDEKSKEDVVNATKEIPYKRIRSLVKSAYDVAVMSLVLSYLPAPEHRIEMVRRARLCLTDTSKANKRPGILFIYEKDSIFHRTKYYSTFLNHWKNEISSEGFTLLKYERISTPSTSTNDIHWGHIFAFMTSSDSRASSKPYPRLNSLYIKQDIPPEELDTFHKRFENIDVDAINIRASK